MPFSFRKCCGICFLLCAFTVGLQAQLIEHLSANNINAGIAAGGNLFSLVVDTSLESSALNSYWLFEAPNGSGMAPIYTSTLWLSGADAVNDIHCAAQRYKRNGGDYSDGPIVTNYDSAYDYYYRRVFKVTKTQIDQHRTINFPILMNTVDSSLLKWPGKGNAYVASHYGVTITDDLAHFIDANSNGIYDPWNGDYPAICGDEGIFFVFNDVRQPHYESGSIGLGVEIRGVAEVYYSNTGSLQKEPLNNTVWVSYEIENKSVNDYHDFVIGNFQDPDLGCFNNDRVGCDTLRNLMFVYNGTNADNDCNGVKGYSPNQVAFGTSFLNIPMMVFGYFTNSAIMDPDYTACADITNYLHARWHDGTPFTFGGVGYNGTTATTHMFPGNPNDTSGWSEVGPNVPLSPGDRRMFAGSSAMNFAVGDIKTLQLAFTLSYDSTATKFSIVDTLKRDADSIQAFYNTVLKTCRADNFALGVYDEAITAHLYPNPSAGSFVVQCDDLIQQLQLHDLSGRLLLDTKPGTKSALLENLNRPSGLYLLTVITQAGRAVKKLIIE